MKNAQTHRNEGIAKELGGKVKKGIGRAIGNEQMEVEGAAKQTEGATQKNVGKVGERVKGAGEEIRGKIRQGLNKP